MKRIALIGHRGVGKTSLLERLKTYFVEHEFKFVDLDSEIRMRTGRELHEIFAQDGEPAFRTLERSVFGEFTLSSGPATIVALGAGFSPTEIPPSWHVIWIRRVTDSTGRIFTDRPRLNSAVSALDEYNERYSRRQAAYAARADESLWLDEGADLAPDPQEEAFFLNEFRSLEGALTLLPENFGHDFADWVARRVSWGIRWFELRDDLLSLAQMQAALAVLPRERVLVSHRSSSRVAETAGFAADLALDWPLELGPVRGSPKIVSLHERSASMSAAFARFPASGVICKAAFRVDSLAELLEGDAWQAQNPRERVFLPSSPDGRWAWYRSLTGYRQELSFFREGDGSGVDQPTLLQWARRPRHASLFASVIGDPVAHSRSPIEHRAFFADYGFPVYAVRVTLDEMKAGALNQLRALGLRWSAVTAPLKELAFAACSNHDSASAEMKSTNTICFDCGHWRGFNTDLDGLREALAPLGDLGACAVWGGGGTLEVMRSALPAGTEFFSLRTGENRVAGRALESPSTVIWAVGRSQADVNNPPASWKPSLVVDLNYAEDSPGRAFALACGSRYVSGLAMFGAQASAQRRHWKALLGEPST